MNAKFKHLRNLIEIHNEYLRIAKPILEHVKEVSKQFIGKKISTLKGLSAKYAEVISFNRDSIEVKPLTGAKWAKVRSVYVHTNYNSLVVEIKLCFDTESNQCIYEDRSYYFGKMEGDILKSIDDDCHVVENVLEYDKELAAIKEFRKLEKLATQAEDKIKVSRDAYTYIFLEDLQ